MSNILRRLSASSPESEETKPSYSNVYEPYSNTVPKEEKISSVLTKDVKFEGEIEFKDELKVFGAVTGTISSNGSLYLEDGSTTNANVKAKDLTVKGNFKGKIEVDGKVKLSSNAKIYGDIKASAISVEEGVIFVGEARVSKSKQQ